jgi:hypothetical protein
MRTFTDDKGREWRIEINVSMIRRISQATGFEICEIVNRQSDVQRLMISPVLIADVCRVACAKQMDAHKMRAEQFDDVFDAPTIQRARTAFLEAVQDFFPNRLWQALAEKTRQMPAMIEQASAAMDLAEVESASTLTSGPSSTDAPESSESTQAA